jgi:hypothetical protein
VRQPGDGHSGKEKQLKVHWMPRRRRRKRTMRRRRKRTRRRIRK